jgi:hypothetical protein
MKIKTSELQGAPLDWAVAKCEGLEQRDGAWYRPATPAYAAWRYAQWQPSTDWAQGGPIIEREGINLGTQRNEPGFRPHPDRMWHAQMDTRVYVGYGPTPLIAAMRCFVASKLGDEVDVPDGLAVA